LYEHPDELKERAMTAARAPLPRSAKGSRVVNREQIIEAATRIADEESIDALTIRRLAAEVGIGAMTLYSYFRNKEEILDGIADDVLGGLALPGGGAESEPREAMRALAIALLTMMREHPSIVRLFTTRVTMSREAMRGALENALVYLQRSGLPGVTAVQAYGLVMHYTLGFASYQAPRSWGDPSHPEVEELRRQRVHFYSGLPLAEFPTMVSLADEMTSLPSDDQFMFGLDCLVDGFLHRLGPGSTPGPAA
jgi:AcrR family transcriptional regulator